MKKRVIVPLVLLLALLLAACDGATDSSEKTIYVGPELVDCVGVAPQQCLQVKESPEADYELFYGQIEGFTFEEGYEYELVIREEQVENPPADASSIRWVLVEEVSRTPAAPAAVEAGGEEVAGGQETTSEESPAEAPAPGTQNLVTIQVGPEMVDCVGVAPQQCLLVKAPEDEEYSLFYDTIEGFEFEPGFEYVLVVNIENVEDAPADAPARTVTLVEVVHKLPVEGGTESGIEPLPPNPLWVLESYRGADGALISALPEPQVTAQFADDRVAGSAGCNSYTGAAVVDGAKITISELARTLALCQPDEIMQQEDAFINLLPAAATFEMKGAQLILRDAEDNDVLIFGYSEDDVVTLEGSYWVMSSYNNGAGAVQGALEGVEVTAEFVDGQVAGTAGCNRYFGSYELDGGNIAIGPLGSTQMFCAEPAGVMEQEAAFLAAMQNAATYAITGDQLELFAADGSRQAVFVATAKAGFTLENTLWIMNSYNNGRGGVQTAAIGTEATAMFADGQVSGNASCNQYFGSYELDGNNIAIGALGSTQMFCTEPEEIMDQEAAFLAALQNAATYEIVGDQLDLYDAEGARQAIFFAAKEEAATLAGPTWNLTSFHSGETVSSLIAGSEITAQFGDDGQVTGSAGCNSYFGSYFVDGETLTIGPLGATRMACADPEGVMQQETLYLSLLDAAAGYSIEGNTLTLIDASGRMLLTFTLAE